jgi:hypothetical protein
LLIDFFIYLFVSLVGTGAANNSTGQKNIDNATVGDTSAAAAATEQRLPEQQ